MTDSVLVPVDGSPLASTALRHALTMFPDATVTALHVVDLFDPGDGDLADTTYEPMIGSEAWYDRAETLTERVLDDARELAATYDRDIDTASDIGDPKRVIVDSADETGIDHVVGAHGGPTGEVAPLGSVATVVARRVGVPVTLVR
ncbi:universal stress protein [Haloplanus halobius]|uniref:universal stress protein n=1 Tax=Haloplanus halobius TaxID=2934938 RepID=UPI00200DBE67|nr:universal stress protein [Haloplanus sp. XH21]